MLIHGRLTGRARVSAREPGSGRLCSVDAVEVEEGHFRIQLRSGQPFGLCSDCGRQSRRVQSRYSRRPTDLPLAGRWVELNIFVRRFWCDAVLCGRRISCERFSADVLDRYGRRTKGFEIIVEHAARQSRASSRTSTRCWGMRSSCLPRCSRSNVQCGSWGLVFRR
ncbi:transposase family protein [Rhizobium tubonense]|uniref:Transposase IS204/IS1001/IS1096/IS1165 zinc-finger domain-containing protein n=1 Tax=Rhizobium tubonense TaxID=484088 RepID=A0A2W4EKE9_9HYPH|nr:hypothetical protein CPY51_11270 [Rhizobium tubonense]